MGVLCLRMVGSTWILLLLNPVLCYKEVTKWSPDRHYNDVIPTSGGYKPDVKSVSVIQCARECRSHGDCAAFTYVATSLTCTVYDGTWLHGQSTVVAESASYFELSWSDERECEVDWFRFGNSCYMMSNTKYTFETAQDYCAYGHSVLAHVSSASEDLFVTTKCQDQGNSTKTTGVCWLGMKKDIGAPWSYTDSNQVPEYTRWKSGEPNISNHTTGCATINGYHGYEWTDDLCSWVGFAVCEKDI